MFTYIIYVCNLKPNVRRLRSTKFTSIKLALAFYARTTKRKSKNYYEFASIPNNCKSKY